MKLHFGWLGSFVIAAALAGGACIASLGSDVRGRFEKTLSVTGPVDLEVSTGSGGAVDT